jgi:hypothetical protein
MIAGWWHEDLSSRSKTCLRVRFKIDFRPALPKYHGPHHFKCRKIQLACSEGRRARAAGPDPNGDVTYARSGSDWRSWRKIRCKKWLFTLALKFVHYGIGTLDDLESALRRAYATT